MPTAKANQWLQIINEQQQSQLSIAEYCRQHGLNPQPFYARKSALQFQGK
ncbi:IS66 family insertion sequence element accessory protein TnpA [Catenovulum agarivorans]|nr:transposase [Catenovulum agarivorans]